MSKKIYIAQPMTGLPVEEIKAVREKATKFLEGQGWEVINQYNPSEELMEETMMKTDAVRHMSIGWLSKDLYALAKCDAAYFVTDWNQSKGCTVEHLVAVTYGLEILYEEGAAARKYGITNGNSTYELEVPYGE